ncbi:MAG TPA: hypothetical protein PKC18_03550 [Lacipirellulaceae bacterium]|nr:hypothetical protein [Lacipirellulaceae bacterium]
MHLIAARQALESGDSERARHELDLAIAARPMVWSYFERARLHAQSGDDAAAQQDVDAGLQLDAESTDLLWLQAELQKPAGQRFNGRFAQPPSAVK